MTEWKYGQHIVALIDVLGQKDKLLTLDHFPKSDEDTKVLSQTLHDTAGYIEYLRKTFQDYANAIKQPTGYLDHLSPEHKKEAEIIRGTNDKIPFRFFSDSMLWEISVDNADQHCKTTRQVYETLYSLCGIFLRALALEKPFRGAIDLGFGVPIGEQNEIYGSALVKAYQLENKIANYPRIVIGESVWQYLTMFETSVADGRFSKAAKNFAADAKSLITIDNDNIRILDIIGKGAKSITGGISKEIVTRAYESLLKIQSKYSAQRSLSDINLMTKYSLLRTYFETRLPLW